jgi:outer membrane receptor for ferrienterochelin and colicin
MKKLLLLLMLFLFVKISYSQKDTANVQQLWDMSLEELMDIKVSGVSRYFQNISDVPNSVVVIDRNTIERRGYKDISDVLKDIIGFDVIDNADNLENFYQLEEFKEMIDF